MISGIKALAFDTGGTILDWDCVVSCEMIGSYKPNPEAYITCAKWLGYRPEEIVMVACHNFDLLAARKVGYRSAFVRRPDEWGAAGLPDPQPDPVHDIVVDDFGQLADQLGCRFSIRETRNKFMNPSTKE